ncbi:hypothetical protein [Bradyrhizobium sp. SZCCHNRI3043]|uniref:hypothetical protein n=1 Tax=Bradyrhizobium sp. SZCCHNRI3043 TaxID=3057292 RepID=UPI0028E3CA9E|nr:hypothetical protein [Bradyrhizobium sp. SZCCHNRI3043]
MKKDWVDIVRNNISLGLCVPAFAGTTLESWARALVPPTPAIYRHMRSQSRGGLRPSYADRFTFLSFALSQVK